MSTADRIKKSLAPYLLIGGLGGGTVLIVLFLLATLFGSNPLNAEFLFWDVILLSFAVFLASLNYHIKRSFRGYKILQTIVANALATILALMVFVTFLSAFLPSQKELITEYKENAIVEVNNNREAFIGRGLKENEIDDYIEDIRNKTPLQITSDMLQKLFLASPFIVFVAFVLILLMHFGLILSRDKLLKKE